MPSRRFLYSGGHNAELAPDDCKCVERKDQAVTYSKGGGTLPEWRQTSSVPGRAIWTNGEWIRASNAQLYSPFHGHALPASVDGFAPGEVKQGRYLATPFGRMVKIPFRVTPSYKLCFLDMFFRRTATVSFRVMPN